MMGAARHILFVVSFLLFASSASAQQRPDFSKLIAAMDKEACVLHEETGVRVCKRDYTLDGKNVEAISFQPRGTGKYPGLLLIPGHATTARDWIPNGLTFARNGYAGLAVSQPGYGRSEGPGDYVGPNTLKVLTEGYRRLQREPFVDGKRMGIVGYSRGGMAASLLAVQLDDLKAVVLGAGVYDFKKAYDETGLDGIRENMKAETGMTPEAIKQRSSILQMEKLKCPVLILHGEKDINVPVSQAYLLRDRLTALKKEFEIQTFPDREHGIGPQNLYNYALDFLKRKLAGEAAKK
ncbi:MAG TPA: alpha/beta fold hydrolase [Blastocatellia bacterium]|nr:alpha/beta fold hydrolase [Blastocatellia bacterium]